MLNWTIAALAAAGVTLIIAGVIVRTPPHFRWRALLASGVCLLAVSVVATSAQLTFGNSFGSLDEGYSPPPPPAMRSWRRDRGDGYPDDVIDAAKAALRSMTIFWNELDTLPFGRSTQVTAIVASASLDAAQREITVFEGNARQAKAELTRDVRATLTAPRSDMDIQLVGGSGTQRLARGGNAQWVWDVTPKRPGETTLTLTIYNQIKDGEETYDFVGPPASRQTIVVKMTLLDWLTYWLGKIDPVRSSIVATATALSGWAAWWTSRPLLRALRPAERGSSSPRPEQAPGGDPGERSLRRPRRTKAPPQVGG